MRRIVQISTVARGSTANADVYTVALCDDGSLWLHRIGGPSSWQRLPGVPEGIDAELGREE